MQSGLTGDPPLPRDEDMRTAREPEMLAVQVRQGRPSARDSGPPSLGADQHGGTAQASDMTSADHAGKSMTEASKDNRLRMSSEVARRFIHGGKGVTDEARPWNDQMAERVDDLVTEVMDQIRAWRNKKTRAPKKGTELYLMYDDFAKAKPWITGTFRGRETQMYAPISAFFRFVAHFVKRAADKDKSLAERCRLVLPFKETDAIPDESPDDKQIDIGLTMVSADRPVKSVPGLSYRKAFAIFEAKKRDNESLGAAKENAHVQLLDYTRNLLARQLDHRFCWGISCVDFTVWACLFSNYRVHESNAMDVTTEDGLEQLVRLILSWSFCDWTQLGYDKTLYWDCDLKCYVIQVPNGAPGKYKTYYSDEVIATADRLFGRHCRCVLASSTRPNGPVSKTNPIIPDAVIKDTWVTYVDRDANVTSDTTAAVVSGATNVDYALKEAEKAAEAARVAERDVRRVEAAAAAAESGRTSNKRRKLDPAIVLINADIASANANAVAKNAVKEAAAAADAAADNAAATADAIASVAKAAAEERSNDATSSTVETGAAPAIGGTTITNGVDAAVDAIVKAVVDAADAAVKAANSQGRDAPTSAAVEAITADIARAVSELASSAEFKHNIATIAAMDASDTAKVVDGNDKVLIAAAAVARAAAAAAARFHEDVVAAIPEPIAPAPEPNAAVVPKDAISALKNTVAASAVATAATSVAVAVAAGTGASAAAAAVMIAAIDVAGSKSRIGTPDAIAAISRGTDKPCISSTVAATAIASAVAAAIVSAADLKVDLAEITRQLQSMQADDKVRLGWPQPGFNPYADESHALLHSEYRILKQINEGLAGLDHLKGCYPELLCGGWVYQPLDPADSRQNANACDRDGSLIRNRHVLGSTHEMLGRLDPRYLHNVPFCAALRIAITPIGRKLNTATSVDELTCVLRDAMRCHMAIYEECGIIHRDISPNNILITERDGVVRGMIIDFGLALDVINNYPTRPERTGTFPYMSVANLENLPIRRTILDDWESLLYMISTTGTDGIKGDRHGLKDAKLPIRQWCEGMAKEVAKAKRRHMNSMDNFQSFIVDEFDQWQPGVDDLKDLAMDLHECLFLNDRFHQGALQYTDRRRRKAADPFELRVDHALEIGKELLTALEAAAAKYSIQS